MDYITMLAFASGEKSLKCCGAKIAINSIITSLYFCYMGKG